MHLVVFESKCAMMDSKEDTKQPNAFELLSDDLIISIISYNIDEKALNMIFSLKQISKQFYLALNPNNNRVNMIWKQICLIRLPNTYIPKGLKMKRWDQYFQYKMAKINQHKQKDDDYKYFSAIDKNDSVIVNCTNDIEEMNGLYSNVFTDKIGKNGLPNNFEWKYKCPVLSDKLKYIDKNTKYCDICKKNVYQVHDTKELQARVEKNECVSLVIYTGIFYMEEVLGTARKYMYSRTNDVEDPHKNLRNNSGWDAMPLDTSRMEQVVHWIYNRN
eukprot:96250_1